MGNRVSGGERMDVEDVIGGVIVIGIGALGVLWMVIV